MGANSWFRWRVGISSVFGLVLSGIVLCLLLRIAVANGSFDGEQRATRSYIVWVANAVTDYQTENKILPPDLQTIWPEPADKPPLVDAWNRPLLYSTRNNQLLIESLGRDGVRGGVGLDADLSNLNLRPAQAILPLGQQLSHPLSHTFAFAALVFGALAGGLVFPTLGRIPVDSRSWGPLAFQLVLTFLMAALMAGVGAIVIAFVHIPWGH